MDEGTRRFIRLCDEHGERLVRDIMRQGWPEQDARDIAQEALIATWKHIGNVNPGAEWVYAKVAAHRLALNSLERDRERGHAAIDERLLARQTSVETRLIHEQEAERFRKHVRATVDTFSPETQLYLALRRRGMSPKEIAARLGVSSDTIRSALKRAFARLRERVGPPPPGVEWAELTGENDDDHQA